MSHFSVTVLSRHPRDVDALLAPYSECTNDPRFLDIETADIPMEKIHGKYELEKQGGESFSVFVERYYVYYLHCSPVAGDYHFYLYCYAKGGESTK